jgi:phosphoribosylanthranilate isomerase
MSNSTASSAAASTVNATVLRDGRRTSVRTKICGVTRVEDAVAAIDLGAAMIGLNFYPPSPRYLTPESAGELVRAVGQERPDGAQDLQWVGVFVDESVSEMARIAEAAHLDLIQLHGDEDPAAMASEMAEMGDLATKIVKVFRVRPAASGETNRDVGREVARKMEPWRALGVWGFLVDTHHPDLYGGTGESWDFASLRALAERDDVRMLLAGGLSPDNVRAALSACRPWGLDLCSGVESEPGLKDFHLMRRLFEEIHHGTTRPAT